MLADRLADALYVDAMIIADDARSYFDLAAPEPVTPFAGVVLSCESSKVTTRLMLVIAWLLARRHTGPNTIAGGIIGPAVISDPRVVAMLPLPARAIVEASIDLFRRAELIGQRADMTAVGPARMLAARLAAAL